MTSSIEQVVSVVQSSLSKVEAGIDSLTFGVERLAESLDQITECTDGSSDADVLELRESLAHWWSECDSLAPTLLRIQMGLNGFIEHLRHGVESSDSLPVRVEDVPQGFTERTFKKFARRVRQLVKAARLPPGDLVVQGSRVRGEAKGSSDIDIALRVDDKTFFALAETALARARPGSKLRKSMLARIRRNGQLGSFELGPEFIALRKEFCDSEAPFVVQFSVLRMGGKLDTPPFRPLA